MPCTYTEVREDLYPEEQEKGCFTALKFIETVIIIAGFAGFDFSQYAGRYLAEILRRAAFLYPVEGATRELGKIVRRHSGVECLE